MHPKERYIYIYYILDSIYIFIRNIYIYIRKQPIMKNKLYIINRIKILREKTHSEFQYSNICHLK